MKEKILKLRAEGKSYREIKNILGCSTSTISYHCGNGQKVKNNERLKKWHKDNPIKTKVDRFKRKNFKSKCRDFRRRDGAYLNNEDAKQFNDIDVIEKFGEVPICYLTGRKLDWNDTSSYHFDHIEPASKNGSNSINNLGIVCKEANIMKSDLTVDELLSLCAEILKYNGYKVEK